MVERALGGTGRQLAGSHVGEGEGVRTWGKVGGGDLEGGRARVAPADLDGLPLREDLERG